MQGDQPGPGNGFKRLGLLRIFLFKAFQKRDDLCGVGVHIVTQIDGVHHADLARIFAIGVALHQFGTALGQRSAVLPVGVQAGANPLAEFVFTQSTAGIAVFNRVQNLEVGLERGIVGAHPKRRRTTHFCIRIGGLQILLLLLVILTQPEVGFVDGPVPGVFPCEVANRLHIQLAVLRALVSGV